MPLAPKSLAEALADFRDDLIHRFPEHRQMLVFLAETGRRAFEKLFTDQKPLHPETIDELCGSIDEILHRSGWRPLPEVIEALRQHRQSIRARLFKGQIEWGKVATGLRDLPSDFFYPFPFGDLPKAMISSFDLKSARLVREGASVNIAPNALRAVFSAKENAALDRDIPRHIYKFADMYPLYHDIFRRAKSLHLFLTVSRMRQKDGTVVPSTPANIVQIHADRFSDDSATQIIREFITARCDQGATDLAVALHANAFSHNEERIKGMAMDMAAGVWGDNPTSTVEDPTLSLVLQAAIAKITETEGDNFTALTHAQGPEGKRILVFARPANEGGQIYLRDESVIDDPSNDLPIAVTGLTGGISPDGRTRWHCLPVFVQRKVV